MRTFPDFPASPMPLPTYDPATYESQLAEKIARCKADFAPFDLPEPEVFRSAPRAYRVRAEFRIWLEGDRVHYAMFESNEEGRKLVVLDDFPPAAPPIAAAMPRLQAELEAEPVLKRKLFQVEFLATLSGELLVSLVYHRRLDAEWEAAAHALAARLGVQLIGRSKGQKIVLERDWVLEAFELDGRTLRYQQVEGSFTQPNAGVNRQMLGWARARVAEVGGHLLELYCGNGNFTIALAPLFGRVLATEMSKTSVYSAQYNLEANAVENVAMVRMSAEEISDALAGGREYRRMRGVDLASYNFTTLFVDPPRAGLDPGTLELARRFEHVLYISCNPETLRDNVAALQSTHRIAAAAAFDQFPYTHHLECGLLLVRR